MQYSCTKHIDIRYHFIRDLVETEAVSFDHVPTERQFSDLFHETTQGLNLLNVVGIFSFLTYICF
jgi:hypothetical protein